MKGRRVFKLGIKDYNYMNVSSETVFLVMHLLLWTSNKVVLRHNQHFALLVDGIENIFLSTHLCILYFHYFTPRRKRGEYFQLKLLHKAKLNSNRQINILVVSWHSNDTLRHTWSPTTLQFVFMQFVVGHSWNTWVPFHLFYI